MKAASELVEARLIKRYKRFLADVELPGGEVITAHCPNTGAMTGCAEPGSRVWLSVSAAKTRKYPHTLELVETSRGLACVHAARANKTVRAGFERGIVSGYEAYPLLKSEANYGKNSRADLLLEGEQGRVYVEVKSVTLCREGGWGAFPDAVSTRGQKHLRELAAVCGGDTRAVMFFCAYHTGVQRVCVAGDVDPVYREALLEAREAGVEIMAWGVSIQRGQVTLSQPLPFAVDPV